MPQLFSWHATKCSPKLKLDAGRTETGKVITKSVSIRNVNPSAMYENTSSSAIVRTNLENVLATINANNPFMLNIYRIDVDGSYQLIQ